MIVGIQSEILKIHSLGLLDRLLADKTTKSHILWATDAYQDRGSAYQRDREITPDLITGENSGIIKNRARKALEQQSERTRQRGEVFTPLWVCARMNDELDTAWFGGHGRKGDRGGLFFQNGQPTEQVIFPKSKKWWRYVDNRRLEITCGEAPYLVSRYDVSTGESIPIENRIGILDRKLRIVTENASDEAEWVEWVIRAYQSTYGYEFQGDNLVIARVNLLMTFAEYLQHRWKRTPTKKEYQTITNIIAWNIWQMDGLTGTIPYCKADEGFRQTSLFDWMSESRQAEAAAQPHCRIYDWRRKRSLAYTDVNTGGRNMKFDYIIGNPPYQEETLGDNKNYAPPIYHLFMDAAYKVADTVELIHPARFLFNAGSTPKAWNEKMLNDPHLKVLFHEQSSDKIFANTDIKGGIVITLHDVRKDFGAIGTFTPFDELNSIMHKAAPRKEESSIMSIIYNQNRFDLETLYTVHPEYQAIIGSNGRDKRFRNNIFEKIDVFTAVRLYDTDISVVGVIKNKRNWRYIQKQFVDMAHENIQCWKVLISSASGTGALGEPLSQTIILAPYQGYTQTYIGVGAVNSKQDALAIEKYLHTKFLRILLGVLKITQHVTPNSFRYVPLQNFTPASDIDWSKSIPEIDRQLYAKYGLDEKEIEFIETHVKEMV